MRLTKRILGLTVAAVAAGGLLLAAAAPAQAAPVVKGVETDAAQGYKAGAGLITFNPHGEIFNVCDRAADGVNVIGGWWRNGAYQGDLKNTEGSGTCVDYNRSAAEGAEIRVEVCLLKDKEHVRGTCDVAEFRA